MAGLLRDPRLGVEFPERFHRVMKGDGPTHGFFQRIVLSRDPPRHTVHRQLMARAFTPRLVRRMEGRIAAIADALLEPALDGGHLEVVAGLAFPLPVRVACELIGIPAADWDLISPWVRDLSTAFDGFVPRPERAAVDAALVRLRAYVSGLFAERRRAPAPDLVTELGRALGAGGEVSHQEVVDNVIFLLFAGHETTVQLIATGSAALLRQPQDQARLRADLSLLPAAVEEFLRYDSPVHSVQRLVREPVDLDGCTVRAGRVVHLLLASANHDERQFSDPERLDVRRAPNPHLAFGAGPHYCLGAALARLEATVAFERVLRRCAAFEPAGEPVQANRPTFRSFASIPAAVRPA